MIQTFLRAALNIGTTVDLSFDGSTTPSVAVGVNVNIAGVDGTLSNLYVKLTVAPGGATARIFTVLKNGVATALTCTISGAATVGSDASNSASFVAGDRLHIEVTATGGTPATTDAKWSIDSDSDTANASFYCANLGAAASGYAEPFHAETGGTAVLCQRLIAYPGTITELWVCNIQFSVSSGTSLSVYLYLNGVKQDGTGGTVNTQATVIAGAANSVYSSTFSLSVVRGDYIYLGLEAVGAYASTTYTGVAIRFEAAVDDISLISMRGGSDPDAGSADFQMLTAGARSWLSTHIADADLICGVTAVGLALLIVDSTVDPGGGNTRTFEVMKAGSVPGGAPTAVMTSGSVLVEDNTGAVDFATGDVVGPMRHTPASSPTVSGSEYWALVMYGVGTGPPTPPPPPNPPGGGGGTGGGIDPTVSNLSTGVKRVFLRLTIGQSSPANVLSFGETMLRDDPAWFGGKKLPRLIEVSPITRELSASIRGVEVRVVLVDDETRPFRTLAATETFSGAVAEIFVVEDAVRYAEGEPYRLFTGKVHRVHFSESFRCELTLRDILSEEIAILDDAPRIPPVRVNSTNFPGVTAPYQGRTIPLVLGQCSDTVETGDVLMPPQGVIPPVILGVVNFTTFGGINQDAIACLWSQCALAANGVWEVYFNPADTPDLRIAIPLSEWGVNAWTPGMPGWEDVVGVGGPDYIDYPPSSAETRRYTPFFINATHPNAQPFLDGKILAAGNLYGIAENDDGSGRYLDDAPVIYQWLLCNFLYTEYRTGAYSGIPSFAGLFSIINTASITTTTARLRSFLSVSPSTYPVGFMLGREGQQQTLRHVLEELCAGVAMEQGIDRHGRLMLDVEDPSLAATVTLTDLMDIETGSFEVWIDRDAYRNRIEYVHGRRYQAPSAPPSTPPAGEASATALQPYFEWTSGLQATESSAAITANNDRRRVEFMENYVVRSAAVAFDVADRLLARAIGPTPSFDGPRMFRLTTSWQGLMKNGIEIELGTVIAIDHLEGLGASGWTDRKGRVLKMTVDPLNARVTLEGRVLYSGGGGE